MQMRTVSDAAKTTINISTFAILNCASITPAGLPGAKGTRVFSRSIIKSGIKVNYSSTEAIKSLGA